MKGAVLYGSKDVRLQEVKKPSVNSGEVLVKIKVALTCGTDAKVYKRGGHPKMIRVPSLFGHEWAGIVEKAGKNVKGFKKGDRVTSGNSAPCFKCYYCKIGEFSLCESLTFMNGAYAEYIKVPEPIVKTNLIKMSSDVSYEEAAFLEPLSCVVHGAEKIAVKKQEQVVIIGAGSIGLLFLQVSKNIGAKVTMVEKDKQRLKIAEKLGCDNFILRKNKSDAINEVKKLSNKGRGMDVAIEATGIPKAWEDSVEMVRGGGRVLFFGGCKPGEAVTLDTKLIHYSELTLKGAFHHAPSHVRKAYELISKKKLNLLPLITDRLPLDKISQALDKILNTEAIKIAIIP